MDLRDTGLIRRYVWMGGWVPNLNWLDGVQLVLNKITHFLIKLSNNFSLRG